MGESKIILPGEAASHVIAPLARLLLPDHIVREREQERAQKHEAAQLQKARADMVIKAQSQLAQASRRAGNGEKLTTDQRHEVNFLAGVALGGASRRDKRRALRKMRLLPSQQRRVKPSEKPSEAEVNS